MAGRTLREGRGGSSREGRRREPSAAGNRRERVLTFLFFLAEGVPYIINGMVGNSTQMQQLQELVEHLLRSSTLLDFHPNATHKMCCNMPYLVAIAAIATIFPYKKARLYVALH